MTLSGLEHFVRKQERLLCEPNGKEAAKMSSVRTAAERRTSGRTHGTGVSETCLCIDSYIHCNTTPSEFSKLSLCTWLLLLAVMIYYYIIISVKHGVAS